jgi:hypothetical protein
MCYLLVIALILLHLQPSHSALLLLLLDLIVHREQRDTAALGLHTVQLNVAHMQSMLSIAAALLSLSISAMHVR